MKTHLARLQFVVALAAAAGLYEGQAAAQYMPYRPAPQAQAPYGYPAGVQQGPINQSPYTAYQPQTQVGGQLPYQQYQPVAQNPYAGYPAQGYAAQGRPGYPAFAQNQQPQLAPSASGGAVQMNQAPQGEPLPTPAGEVPVQGIMPGQGDVIHQGHEGHMHANGHMNGYSQNGNCAPYPSTGHYGSYAGSYPDYGLSGYFNQPCEDMNQWFGGIYGLYMERDNDSFTRITVMADPPSYPYYPPARVTVISTDDIDHDFREGVEIRFGSTFTVGGASCDTGCDPYGYGYAGCNTCSTCEPAQLFAWEVAFWGIDRDIKWFTVTDFDMTDTDRIYGMVNYAGLEYDDGSGGRPVNDYYDYQMPIDDDNPPVAGDLRVFSQRVRTNFRAQNLELNFLRIPVCDVGCSTASCGYDNCGGYGHGYGQMYGGGYGCEPAMCAPSGPAFSMAALCGIRYFRMEDDFELSTDANEYDGADWIDTMPGWDLFHDIQVENHLVGFQLGVNMNYCIACKWNVFCDSNFGLYNNHINHYQRVYGPAGAAYFVEEARDATVRSEKDDIAFLGEMRLGGAYDLSCHWRAVLAYRAVAISGVALSTEQIKPEMSNWAEAARIDSNGSAVIHGVQAGVECKY
jgi:hypothetical protein